MRILMAAAALLAVAGSAGAAHAQSSAIEGRVDRLEREMRAVQRKVFPGGAGQTVEPQITAPQPTGPLPGTPASSPITDLTQRVNALESQVQQITGQVEQSQYRLRQLEDAFNAYKRSVDARLGALEQGASAVGGVGGDAPAASPTSPAPAVPAGGGRLDTPARPMPAGATRPAPNGGGKVDPARAAEIAAVEKPNSGDPAEDAYLYGYRLWAAKLYPEARKSLETVVTKYPDSRRASYAQNLLGRAYLDSGAPSLAAVAFYENYKKNPNGERAPDSLYYLAQALVQLKKPNSEVCKVYDELMQLYGDRISSEMRAGVADGRARAKCK